MAEEKSGGFKRNSDNTEIGATVEEVVAECNKAINNYDLKNLLEKAKTVGYAKLTPSEKENLCTGLIKLGEALTFCKEDCAYNNYAYPEDVRQLAESFAKVRNHLIHKELYYKHLPDNTRNNRFKNTLQTLINNLPTINDLQKNLTFINRASNRTKAVKKQIRSGENNFPFTFDHAIDCLEKELNLLSTIYLDIENNQAAIDNCIRNILTMLVDCTSMTNTYGNSFVADSISNIQTQFCIQFPEMGAYFRDLKKNRNSLCHLDASLAKPYSDETRQEFCETLLMLKEHGYAGKLKKWEEPQIQSDASYTTVPSISTATTTSTLDVGQSNVSTPQKRKWGTTESMEPTEAKESLSKKSKTVASDTGSTAITNSTNIEEESDVKEVDGLRFLAGHYGDYSDTEDNPQTEEKKEEQQEETNVKEEEKHSSLFHLTTSTASDEELTKKTGNDTSKGNDDDSSNATNSPFRR